MGRKFLLSCPSMVEGKSWQLIGITIAHWKRKRLMRNGINDDRRGENKCIIEVVDVVEVASRITPQKAHFLAAICFNKILKKWSRTVSPLQVTR